MPSVVKSSTHARLFAFAELHKTCGHASDKGWIDIGLKMSDDMGATWSDLRVLYSEHDISPGTWVGNPCPLIDELSSTLWLIFCRNNTDVLAMKSTDWGTSWSTPKVISQDVLAPQWRSTPSWKGGWGWVATGPPVSCMASSLPPHRLTSLRTI